jgi:hypothetical protein
MKKHRKRTDRSVVMKGWTAERRAACSDRIRQHKPWEHSTGPRSVAGKARSSRNPVGRGRRQLLDRELAEIEAFMRSLVLPDEPQ